MKKIIYKNILLSIGSLIFALILCEIALWLFVPLRNVGPSFSVYDSVYGKRHKKNFTAIRKSVEFTMRCHLNSLGFRGPEPKSFPNTPILFIGDSYTEGYGVNDGEEFPELVRISINENNKNNRIPVVNAGIGNTGTAHWIKFLTLEGEKYNPRYIILQFSGNDFLDNVAENLFKLSPSGKLVELPVSPPGLSMKIQKTIEFIPFLAKSHIAGFARQVFYYLSKNRNVQSGDVDPEIAFKYEDDLTFALFGKTLEICRKHEWPVFVVIVDMNKERLSKLNNLLQQYEVDSHYVPDRNERPDLYYKIDGHWNAAGHKYVSDYLIKNLNLVQTLV
ncbi:SGNH/GDSL hydrolase family protein [candidate division KSB1 bacterium]